MTYSLYCGDEYVCTVSHKVEKIGVLSKKESDEILEKARKTNEYKNYNRWLGFGYLTIKINL